MNQTSVSTEPARPEPRWLDEQEMAAWRGFIDTLGPLLAALDTDLAPFGLSHGDYEVLVRLSEQPEGQLRMCDLAKQLTLSPSGLTRRLDRLVSTGLVGREPCPQDRRATLAVLTPTGHDALRRAAPAHLAGVRRRFVDMLSDDECAVLAAVFTKVRAAAAD